MASSYFGERRAHGISCASQLRCTPVFGGLYAARVLEAQRSLGFSAERQRALVTFAMLTGLFAFTLGLPALDVARRLHSGREPRTAAIARASAGLAFAGILLALLVTIVLDAAGVLASLVR
jgi:hypothetical protein